MEANTIVYVLATLVGIVGLSAFMRKEKKVLGVGKNILGFVFVGVAVFLISMQMGYLETTIGVSPFAVGTGVGTDGTDNQVNLDVDVTGCDLGTKSTITLSAIDQYTTSATGGYHRYKVNGAPSVELADAGTFTASPGDKVTIFWNNGTTTGYYSQVSNVEVPCAGAKTFYTNAVNNATLSSSLKDSDDIAIDTSSTYNNQTLSAGDVKDVSIKLSGTYQKAFPYGFVAVIEYNNTNMDNVILSDESGNELGAGTVLQSYSSTYGAESSKKAYIIPAIVSNQDLRIKATLDADDTISPGPSGGDAIIVLYPMNYFINEKNGGAFEGPAGEDEKNSLTRAGGFTVTVQVD